MTQELSSNQPSDDFDAPITGESLADDATELAALLSEAFDAPPVPKSLVQRLDGGIQQRWGHSPELVPSRRVASITPNRMTWAGWWPVAVGLATVLLLAFVLVGGSGNYAWASVIDAIKRQGLVQISDAKGTRWLDLSQGVAGRQTELETQWIDVRKRIVMTRVTDSRSLQRTPLMTSDQVALADSLLAAFLLDQSFQGESLDRLRGMTVIREDWDKTTNKGREVIDLHVQFQTADAERFSLSLLLDPESNLPLAVSADNPAMEDASHTDRLIALSYPSQTVAGLQAVHFPTNLTIVESTPEQRIASVPKDVAPIEPSSKGGELDSGSNANLLKTEIDSASEQRNSIANHDDPINVHDATVASLPIGAANKWAPVTVIQRSDVEVVQRVDTILQQLWDRENVHPVGVATDLQLLRRSYLDLAGRTPTVTEVRRYINDQRPDRYERLVENLLSSPDHASQLAAVWRSFLIPEGVDLDAFGGRESFEKWLAERFAAGEPYDQIVRKLLLAEGRLSQSGPLLFYTALKLDADQLAARTSRVFLGMRLECAQCHDHPFEAWSQEDFWSYAAFFAQISRPKGELENVSTVMRVRDIDRGDVMLPETEIVIPPRFLGGEELAEESVEEGSAAARRQRLSKWMTGPENPYFARATANRLWNQLLGRGIVDPVDDFGEMNQPISPELLDTLASQLIDSGFELKKLIRTIVLSKAYRLSSSSGDLDEAGAAKRLETFAQMNVKTLTAEQLYDCIAVATLLDQDAGANSNYTLARFGNSQREEFLQQFAAPASSRAEYLAGIPQALMLMNGSLIIGATGENSSGLIRSLQAPFFSDRQRIDVLFMATLSRPASPQELDLLAEFVPEGASSAERSAGLADLLWALLNSAEFTLNH